MNIATITIVDSEGKIWTANGSAFTEIVVPEVEEAPAVEPEVVAPEAEVTPEATPEVVPDVAPEVQPEVAPE